jgi:lactoylglutathione lyase
MEEVNRKSADLFKDGYRILRGPRKTGDGYWEFETLDPDNNRIEVSALFKE